MRLIYFALLLVSFSSCCYLKNDAPTPKVETPKGYDQIKHTQLADIQFNIFTGTVGCEYKSDNKGGSQLIHITNDNNTFDQECWTNELPTVDWTQYDVVRCFLGSASYTVYADMRYKVFISHETKEVLIKSSVTKSGACGSDNEYYSWIKVFKIPKVPVGYTLRVDIKGAG